MVEPHAEQIASYQDAGDTASFDDDPLPRALAQYGLHDLAALEVIDQDEPLHDVRILAAEYVARQLLLQHCPNWTTFLVEAILSCIDFRRSIRIGSVPGDGARKTKDVVVEHRAVGEVDCIWNARQTIADPLDAGISPIGFVKGELAPRLRIPVTYPSDPAAPALVCFAKPDPALSGREDQIAQIFIPKPLAWAEGTTRISTLTRAAFADLLARVRSDIAALLQPRPIWNVAQAVHEDLERIARTTGPAKRPSANDKAAIRLAVRAVRNLVGSTPELAMHLAQIDYVYRRYEVLR